MNAFSVRKSLISLGVKVKDKQSSDRSSPVVLLSGGRYSREPVMMSKFDIVFTTSAPVKDTGNATTSTSANTIPCVITLLRLDECWYHGDVEDRITDALFPSVHLNNLIA